MQLVDTIWSTLKRGMILSRPNSTVRVKEVTPEYVEYGEVTGNDHSIRLYKTTFLEVLNKMKSDTAKGDFTTIKWFVTSVRTHRSNFYVTGHLLLANNAAVYQRGVGYKVL